VLQELRGPPRTSAGHRLSSPDLQLLFWIVRLYRLSIYYLIYLYLQRGFCGFSWWNDLPTKGRAFVRLAVNRSPSKRQEKYVDFPFWKITLQQNTFVEFYFMERTGFPDLAPRTTSYGVPLWWRPHRPLCIKLYLQLESPQAVQNMRTFPLFLCF
jgi:hypothetical protein